jgi:tetratricopeptide (TPR) repeat protein
MSDRRGGASGRVAVAGLACAVFLMAYSASADSATAEALFREGRRLLDEGRYAEACSKLAESQIQDPASGTLINLALCYEKQGRLATAWAEYRNAAVLARRDGRADRVATAEQKIAELEPRVPRLVVHAAKALPGMEARWGNVRIGAGAFDAPIPIDPGSYVVTVTAPGHEDFSASLTVAENESKTLEVPELRAKTAPPSAPATAAPATERERRGPPAPVPPPEASISAPGLVLGGAGIALLGVGTIFGISSLNAYSDAEEACPTHQGCSPAAKDARDEAETKAWIANISLGAGLLAAGLGAWFVVRGSSERPRTTGFRVTPTRGGATFALSTSL